VTRDGLGMLKHLCRRAKIFCSPTLDNTRGSFTKWSFSTPWIKLSRTNVSVIDVTIRISSNHH